MLSDRYLNGIPHDGRAARDGSFSPRLLTNENLERLRTLNAIAARRGQSLAQMAIAWALRDERITSALIGARTVEQLDNSLGALDKLAFGEDELAEIDTAAQDGGIDIWRTSSAIRE
jgi:L-glyceraldehyde 3-phosphate reductase